MFDQILELIGQPPGSLVYHIIVLSAVQFALMIGLGQWLRERDSGTGRLTLGIAVVFVARVLLLVVALLVMGGYISRSVILPPVERAVDTLSIVGLFWVFITMDDPSILRRNFMPDMITAMLMGLIIVGFVGTYYYWFSSVGQGLLFNGLWLDMAWSGAQAVISAVGFLWMLTRIKYVYDPLLKGIMLLLAGSAAGLHLARIPLGDVAISMRAGQLLLMPMLAAVAYRHTVEQLLHFDEFEPSRQTNIAHITPPAFESADLFEKEELVVLDETVAKPPPDMLVGMGGEGEDESVIPTEPRLLEVVDTLGGLLSTLEQSRIPREAARVVASALRADICGLAVVDEVSQEAGVIGGYDNITQTYLPQAILNLSDHPAIVNTLGRLRQMRLTTQRNSRELQDFYTKLLISHVGPAYLQPLFDGEERIGVLIVGSPYSERFLSNEERNLLDRLAPLVTAAMLNAEAYDMARSEVAKISTEEGARMASLADELTATRIEHESALRQIDEMKAYIRDLHRQLEAIPPTDPEQVEALEAEIERLNSELNALEKHSERIEEERSALQTRLDALQVENAELQAHIESDGHLEGQYNELKQQYDSLLEKYQHRSAQESSEEVFSKPSPQDDRIARLEAEIERLQMNSSQQQLVVPMDQHIFQQQLDETRLAAQTEIASLRARLAQASISQQEVAILQEQLAAKAREAIQIQARLTEAQAVAEALKEQIQHGPNSSVQAFQERIAIQQSEITILRAQLDEMKARSRMEPEAIEQQEAVELFDQETMEQLEKQLEERAELVEQLQKQLSEKNRALNTLRSHMSEVELSLRNLEHQLSSKTDEIELLQTSLAESRHQAQSRIMELENQIERGESTEDVETQRVRAEALEAELAEKATAIEVLETQLQNTREAMQELETQLAATNQAVGEAISEAQQDDSHTEVIASIAQELRGPMSSIMGYTELLLRESVGFLGALQRKFLLRVKANTERMGVLLDDLIRVTALDTGSLELITESVDVAYAVEEVIMSIASQFREKGLVLRFSIADNLPRLYADRDSILQVLGHLLTNAVLASPVDGEVQLTVTTSHDTVPAYGDEATDCLFVSVEDAGGGIAPEDFERVFSRQYRADNPLIEGLGDTGVSLSLAKTLIDAHGGRIWLDSHEGVGTTFFMLLPLKSPNAG